MKTKKQKKSEMVDVNNNDLQPVSVNEQTQSTETAETSERELTLEEELAYEHGIENFDELAPKYTQICLELFQKNEVKEKETELTGEYIIKEVFNKTSDNTEYLVGDNSDVDIFFRILHLDLRMIDAIEHNSTNIAVAWAKNKYIISKQYKRNYIIDAVNEVSNV